MHIKKIFLKLLPKLIHIIGNVDVTENKRIYQFFVDSYRVDNDFQSEIVGPYIN